MNYATNYMGTSQKNMSFAIAHLFKTMEEKKLLYSGYRCMRAIKSNKLKAAIFILTFT